ncbi:Ca2+-binding RTX toxin-like protein [Rhodopseudomonas julia]|uniref:Ca2+-binding RTX toxin-like protein n=1 Tax=Rhodopseudomonas julia TaxID=200617 RepID=A0ABU0C8S6_9BRAD|nr:calcium-binding protein [Rhodopseudomonas julia]MDQ0326045.1 Ca2+-binding RTX toxin-like protein [Rhodopseudomonas julia]
MATFYGTENSETMVLGPGNDRALAYGGADTIFAGPGDTGDDNIFGGAGDDLIFGKLGDDDLRGGSGNDTIFGGDGADELDPDGAVSGEDIPDTAANVNHVFGGAGDDRIAPAEGSDFLGGGDGNDYIEGGGGNDVFFGGRDAGNDTLYAGAGNDTIYAGAGNDFLYAGDGNDILFGGDGSDVLFTGNGNTTLWGGAGDDWLYGSSKGFGPTTMAFVNGSGADTIYLFDIDQDRIDISAYGFSSNSAVSARAHEVQTTYHTNVVINLGGGSTIEIDDMELEDINDITFIF